MTLIPEQLLGVRRDLEAGKLRWAKVKTLLSWFGRKGRGKYVVQDINKALDETRIFTDPAFTSGGVHGYIEFKTLPEAGDHPREQSTDSREDGDETRSDDQGRREPDAKSNGRDGRSSEPTGLKFCIGMLEAANRPSEVLTITRDQRVEEAITVMMIRRFSQLPVTQDKRQIDGMISWRSMGRARARGDTCEFVRDCVEPVPILNQDDPFFDAVDTINEKEVVLVLGRNRTITGIVTTADLSREYHQKAAPFLLLGEIEDRIRILIDDKLSTVEIKQARHPDDGTREIEDASDLTFGEYVRLLESPENWEKLCLGIDRKLFVELLNDVRDVRNDVMHFRPDSSEPENLGKVRQLHSLLEQLVP